MPPFEVGVRHAARNQHRQPDDHAHANAQECQKIVEWRHAENGIIGIKQVADADSRNNRRGTAGNQQRESAAVLIVTGQILR